METNFKAEYPEWIPFRDKVAIPFFMKNDLWFCWICGADNDTLIIDHIKPRGMGSKKSMNALLNLQVLDFEHHQKKELGMLSEREERDMMVVRGEVAEIINKQKGE